MARYQLVSATTLEKFSRLADLLEQAGKLSREISRGKTMPFRPSIPALKPPKRILKGQEWFWSKDWQKAEREANRDFAEGRFDVFDSVEDLIADLHANV